MATLKYKDGSTWKTLSLGGTTMTGATATANGIKGEVPAPQKGEQGYFLRGDAKWANITLQAPTSFTGITPATLKQWANDCVNHPEVYEGLLGQNLVIESSGLVGSTTTFCGSERCWKLMSLNHYTKYNTNDPCGFVFFQTALKPPNTLSGSQKYVESSQPVPFIYDSTEFYKSVVETYYPYIKQSWLDIFEEVTLYTYGYSKYNTSTAVENIVNSKKLFSPSAIELGYTNSKVQESKNAIFDYVVKMTNDRTGTVSTFTGTWTRTTASSTNFVYATTSSYDWKFDFDSSTNLTATNNAVSRSCCFCV